MASPFIPRGIGSAAGILAVSLLLYSVVGALWGLLRPAYSGTVSEEGRMTVDPTTAGAEFVSFGSFAVATGLLAVIVSLSVYVTSASTRGPVMLWWLTGVALVSAFSFLEVGSLTAGLLHAVGDPDALRPGDAVTVVPRFDPGVGWLVAPFMAGLSYWSSALVTPEPEAQASPIQ